MHRRASTVRQPASVAASSSWHVGRNPSALMRAPHHLHGVLDVTPLLGFIVLALALANQGIAGRCGSLETAEPQVSFHLPPYNLSLSRARARTIDQMRRGRPNHARRPGGRT